MLLSQFRFSRFVPLRLGACDNGLLTGRGFKGLLARLRHLLILVNSALPGIMAIGERFRHGLRVWRRRGRLFISFRIRRSGALGSRPGLGLAGIGHTRLLNRRRRCGGFIHTIFHPIGRCG
ncbi:MAG TPA: hypothetical protein PLM77_12210 [Phycisphaerae bacterium]|nr:hypothetical protein [Phycisphaerae bacterium]